MSDITKSRLLLRWAGLLALLVATLAIAWPVSAQDTPPSIARVNFVSATESTALFSLRVENPTRPLTIYYQVRESGSTTVVSSGEVTLLAGDITSINSTDLESGTAYEIDVSLDDTFPVGETTTVSFATEEEATASVTAVTVPDSSVTRTAATATVSVTDADDTGIYLRHRISPSGAWEPTVSQTTSEDSVDFRLTGLMGNTGYEVRASLDSTFPAGEFVSDTFTTDPVEPGAPGITSVTHGNGSLTVNWNAPTDTGGANITGYTIEWKLSTAPSWTGASSATDNASPYTITGLDNGSSYYVRVTARNFVGDGPASTLMSGTPSTTPGAPDITGVTPGDGSLMVAWNAPADTGGANITGYTIEWKLSTAPSWTGADSAPDPDNASPYTVTGLTNGNEYNVRVMAANMNGGGVWSSEESATPRAPKPGAPTITSLTHGDRSLTVAWEPPSGADITSYKIKWRAFGGAFGVGLQANRFARQATIPNLTNGILYEVQVIAGSDSGDSDPSDIMRGTPSTTPGAPAITGVTPGDGSLTVAWTAPTDTGGAAITGYTIEWKLSSTPSWEGADSDVDNASPYTIGRGTDPIMELNNGSQYDVRISASNISGGGAWASSMDHTPSGTPNAPAITGVTPGDGSLMVAWTAPTETGGSPITGYTIEWKLSSTPSWTGADSATPTASPYTIMGLDNGSEYDVRVSASNVNGGGAWVSSMDHTPSTTPGKPSVTLQAGMVSGQAPGDRIRVSWTEPDDGGLTITSYKVQWKYGSETFGPPREATVNSPALHYTIRNLDSETEYDVQVIAFNMNGDGEPSDVQSRRPSTIPGAPVLDGVTRGDGQLNAFWSAASYDGGSTITGYRMFWRPIRNDPWPWPAVTFQSADIQGLSYTYAITGLINHQLYDVVVTAVNINGPGEPSNQVTKEPFEPPGKPVITSIEKEAGALKVTWTRPTGNSLKYRVEWKLSSTASWDNPFSHEITDETTLTYTITGVTDGTSYDVRVIAANVSGETPSDPMTVTAGFVPGAPTGLTLTAGDDGSLTALWNAPGSDGGSAITGYRLENKTESQAWAAAQSHSSTVTTATVQVKRGFLYVARVIAINDNGESPPSGEAEARMPDVPGPPTGVTLTSGDKELSVVWTAPAPDALRPVDQYVVRWREDGETYDASREARFTTSDQVVGGLTNGIEYFVQVSAENSVGESAPSAEVSETPGAAPGQPTDVTVTPGDGTLTIEWSAPSDDGGFTVTEYRVQWKSGDEEYNETDRQAVVTSGLTYTITGLTNDTLYTVRVLAVNEIGPSAPSGEVNIAPGLVTSLSGVSVLDGSVTRTGATVQVTIANQDGEARTVYLRHRIATTPSEGWSDTQSVSVTDNTSVDIVLSGLNANTTYEVQVSFDSTFPEEGLVSLDDLITASTTPGAPTGVTLESSGLQLRVSWVAPDDGGSPITDYRIQWTNIGESFEGALTEEDTVNGQTLTYPIDTHGYGLLYDVRVIAVNEHGDSEPSETVTGAATKTPGAPTITSVTPGAQGELVVEWNAPTDTGGSNVPLTEYIIEWKLTSAESWEGANSHCISLEDSDCTISPFILTTSYTIQGLTNGETYDVRVRAVNQDGAGDPSTSVTVTISGDLISVPGSPAIRFITPGDGELTVNWSAPSNTGGSAITSYRVQWKSGAQEFNETDRQAVVTSGLAYTIDGLANGALYTVRVIAVNDIGPGDPSSELTAEPTDITFPSISIGPAAVRVTEGEPAAFTLTRENDDSASPLTLTVNVSQTGSVLADAAPEPLTVSFAADEATSTLTLATDDDNVVENDGQVTATVTAPTGYLISGAPSATVTVADNDNAEFTLFVDPASIEEGEISTVTVSITNSVTFAEDQTIALDFTGTAAAGEDFTIVDSNDQTISPPYSVILPAGAISVNAAVRAVADTETEETETIEVEASHGGNTIGTGTITIPANMGTDGGDPATEYDHDKNGVIDKSEAIEAVIDYFAGRITKEDVIEIILLYFTGGTRENESPEFPEGPSTVRSVAENSPVGTHVGNPVAAEDVDDDALTYTLGGEDAASFEIDGATGQIKVGAGTALDYETETSYTVSVTATDPSGASATITVTITVTDVDLGTPYDRDRNEVIDRNEAIEAVIDYFAGRITKDEVFVVIELYFAS